ncbi:mechanosensitive ion channel family protein [Allosphingosinicella deserti]|uniref:Mechanosensitive ion channel MscS domain-containing protein n=1 Tax=Allosphingosinicella deserti TaxID=2116704 RepID=A0A2P7QZ71_9SPHN|nr:mechanosensitive ion channel domain-containing protein [Sphingomonas deserti]PSJ43246.1 hypothetical protein C7I55_02370 [Sphingomonas deserti]
MERLAGVVPLWLGNVAIGLAAVVAAAALHWIIVRIAYRAGRRTPWRLDDLVIRRIHRPSFWLLVAFALSAVQPAMALGDAGVRAWTRIASFLFPALVGWTAIALLGSWMASVEVRTDISVADNLRARRRRTRAGILYRIAVFLVLLVTICMMLMSIPSVRNVGVTLIASAGIAGLAVGAAAQPALKNLIAGIQMAFTEPIRIDDVVIVNGEWGRIEEIRLTYVVIKIWDERRLVVPVSKFLEESFENWTRKTSQLLGSVFWHLDPAADIPRLREKLEEIVKGASLWDGRFFNLQVTNMSADAIEVRALVTAADASKAFDLRCDLRERMLAFIREEMPEALVRRRGEITLEQRAVPDRS